MPLNYDAFIAMIAAAILGYTDVFYFSRVFKKTFGVPPSEYKQ